MDLDTLHGVKVVTLAPNVPGPVAAARLRDLGAQVMKVEAPAGDPLALTAPAWYESLHRGMSVERLDLKSPAGRAALDAHLAEADVLLTSSRMSALDRLGLGWEALHRRFPQLVHVGIVGYPPPDDERAGHDLNYVAQLGLVDPPAMPKTLIADLAGAERAVSTALGLLLRRERGDGTHRELVSLREAATVFGEPLAHGLTAPDGVLGGTAGIYRLYQAHDGWVAVGALEPHFAARLRDLLGVSDFSVRTFTPKFLGQSAQAWQIWGIENDVPVSVVSESVTPVT